MVPVCGEGGFQVFAWPGADRVPLLPAVERTSGRTFRATRPKAARNRCVPR